MRAVRFSHFGDPLRVLSLEHVAAPEPRAGEVRVRFTHRAINPSDLLTIRGLYPIQASLPVSPGLEGVGVIDAVGDGVTGLANGHRVISLAAAPGTWAEHFVIPAQRALPIPDAISDQVAAQALVNPLTAWVLMYDELQLREGEWLLQTAAGSTLGQLVIQLARRQKVRTLNVVRRRSQMDEVLRQGGDAVVCSEDESLEERVREITGSDGLAAAIDSVGGILGAQVAACLRPHGVMLSVGFLNGFDVGPIGARALIFNGITIRGFWLAHWFGRRAPDAIGRGLSEVLTLLALGELRPTTEAEYDLGDFRAAIAHAERTGRRGKILLVG